MSTATISIVSVRRVAAALGHTEARIVKAAEQLGIELHSIDSRPYIDVDDEDRIAAHLAAKGDK